jgi:thiol:disulfide interchange protein DsbD
MRKLFFLSIFVFFLSAISNAQDSSILHWTYSVEKNTNGYVIHYRAEIPKGWCVYDKAESLDLAGPKVNLVDSSLNAVTTSILSKNNERTDPIFDQQKLLVYKDSIHLSVAISGSAAKEKMIATTLYYELADDMNFQTEEVKLKVSLEENASQAKVHRVKIQAIDINKPLNDCGVVAGQDTSPQKQSLWNLFFIGFLGGLIALLTPCVFPMIPLTVSFFTKKASSRKSGIRNAFLYGFFIFAIYLLLSLPFHFLDQINPEILNNISTNAYLNLFFFVIFLFFAFSFFGFYELTLPASLSSGADSKAGAGKIIGIFFMALTLALVSFSCTGPILGSLLAGSLASDGGAMQLTAGMGGFGFALALPFALFALFPNWLQSLPKSGGWLNTVKVVLGFLEIALALKFLSNADLVKHWGLLKREVFIGIWVLVGSGLTAYLFGWIHFPHDNKHQKIGTIRKITAMLVAIFTLYLIPGLTNTTYANLKLISGFPPPLYYSVYQQESDCVLGLTCTRDYEEGIALGKKLSKPVLLDFTGYACVNCRRMEENVWSDPEVYKMMKNEFVVVSLYVDDKKALPVSEQFTFTSEGGLKKEITTYGDLWATFETENFSNNAQPLYAILNHEEKLLNHPVGYTPDKKTYLEWLSCGLKTFKDNK